MLRYSCSVIISSFTSERFLREIVVLVVYIKTQEKVEGFIDTDSKLRGISDAKT